MKQSDLRSARYGELLETLIDDPQRDVKIAHEMGWDIEDDEPAEGDFNATEFMNQIAAEVEAENEAKREAGIDPAEEWDREREAEEKAIPAYMHVNRIGDRLIELYKPYHQDDAPKQSEEDEELLGQGFISIQIAGAKIIGGHGMGYEDEVICGNIVNCKRALEAAEQGVEAWNNLRGKKFFTPEAVEEMIVGHEEAVRLINERIAELRKKVWW